MTKSTLSKGEKKTLSSEILHYIREKPRTSTELEEELGYSNFSEGVRRHIEKLSFKSGNSGIVDGGGTKHIVYYIHGDERRAVRKYIKENETFIHGCLEQNPRQPNILLKRTNEYIYRLFLEEWRLREEWDVP